LATHLSDAEEEATQKESVKLWERYTSLEPHDPRGFRYLGIAYSALENKVQTEAAYRKALELNPADDINYYYLVYFLAVNDRVAEVKPLLVAYDQHKDTDEDVFVMTIQQLYFASEAAAAEKLAASEPARVKNSSEANVILGRIHLDAGRYAVALNYLKIAAKLDEKTADPHIAISRLHRKQARFSAALKASDQAIKLDPEYSEAYYERACALARLGRLKDAMTALEKSIELDEDQLDYIADEGDLKPLSSLPAFKKLLAPPAEKP
ncbi:MAG TPA: tetratricopeptide repeat protein, partial [Pyrinomonadaceae bacterium]|nr:tetratricopeptide repeat protein [Pyrinomonadaceae bacterium]